MLESGKMLFVLVGGAILVAIVALSAQAERPRPRPVDPPQIDGNAVQLRKADPAYVDLEAPPSPEAVAQAEELAAAERDLVASERQKLTVPGRTALPSRLEAAIPSAPDLAADALAGLHLVDVRDEGSFQEATYSDGTGILSISWQRWPEDVDPSIFVTEFATVERVDDLDVVVEDVDLPGVAMRSVRLFDGTFLVTVSGYDIEGLDIGPVRRLAEHVYRGIATPQSG